MPMTEQFENRLYPNIEQIAGHFGTPFHIYDEAGIRETGKALKKAFSGVNEFREYFAVKALANPRILKIMRTLGFGFDCSSIAELHLARSIGASGEDIMFSSNNTDVFEFDAAAANGGSILNLDDISLIPKVPHMPELICFRHNPGRDRTGNVIIGNPVESKYGLTTNQLQDAFSMARERGAKRFGLHTMLASNELDYSYMVKTTQMLLKEAERITEKLGILFEFVNIGGGLGITYLQGDQPFDLDSMGTEITTLFHEFERKNRYVPKLYLESGRYLTGPHGVLVTRVINRKETYRTYIGVDACMSSLMRPGLYGAYHHITVSGKDDTRPEEVVDVVGSLCENNDKFAIQRSLPVVREKRPHMYSRHRSTWIFNGIQLQRTAPAAGTASSGRWIG